DADEFLSTPSSQRATADARFARGRSVISIHALFAEGDVYLAQRISSMCYFYPRPLRRGRPAHIPGICARRDISIHALFAEGDSSRCTRSPARNNFYPRPLRRGRLFFVFLVTVREHFYP